MKGKKIKKEVGKLITDMARKVALMDANTSCAWLSHQPKLPEGVKKLRKF